MLEVHLPDRLLLDRFQQELPDFPDIDFELHFRMRELLELLHRDPLKQALMKLHYGEP